MEQKVRWGVLGTASIARKHTIAGMKQVDNCELYAIAGRSLEKAEQFKQEFGFQKAYGSYDELLDDPKVQAVYIPLPNHLHRDWVIKAAKKKKHILCEKPLSGTEKDCREMIEVCDKEGVLLMEAFAYLHSPIIRQIKRDLDDGVIGKLQFMESTFVTEPPADTDIRMNRESLGGSLFDLGCYNTTLTLLMYGEEPEEVQAMAHYSDRGIDDCTNLCLTFSGNRKATAMCGMCSGQWGARFYLYGSDGTIEALFSPNEDGELHYTILKNGEKEVRTITTPDNYGLEVKQFGDCILSGERPLVSHEFTMRNARVLDRALQDMGYWEK